LRLPPESQAAAGQWSKSLKNIVDHMILDAGNGWLEGVRNGWLEGVRRVPSPNCDERPQAGDPELIVIHSISLPEGQFGTPHVEGRAPFVRGHCAAAGVRPRAHPPRW
jgi:hypothetical protein